MGHFTTILWDLDNTLLDFEYSQRCALEEAFRGAGLTLTEEQLVRYGQINDSYWKRLEKGEVTKAQLLVGRFVDLFREFGIEHVDMDSFRRTFQEALGANWSYLDRSLELCQTLQGKVKQYVVTNGVAATQRQKMGQAGFLDLFCDVFISEEIGAPKPQKAFFENCLSRVEEQDKQKILLVGDSLTSDILGGKQVGIPTCWFRRKNTPLTGEIVPDYEITHLWDLLELLDKAESKHTMETK